MKKEGIERRTLRGRGCVSMSKEQAWSSLGERPMQGYRQRPMINARPRLASEPEKMREI